MDPLPSRTEAQAIADIVEAHLDVKVLTLGDTQVLAVPKGVDIKSVKPLLDEYLTAPERRKGIATFQSLTSFIEHTKRFADTDSVLFADASPKAPSLTSVLDYHRKTAEGAPRYGQHRGIYRFPLSDEWTAWQAQNAQPMTQTAFAEFVENHITDALDPASAGDGAKALAATLQCTFASPSRLLDLSRGLSVRVGSKVQNATNLATGEAQFTFVTQHQDEAGAPLKVPSAFLIGIPVFKGGPPYQIASRLRYRIRDGVVSWFYELYRADRVFDHAFNEACETATKETALPLFLGAPE